MKIKYHHSTRGIWVFVDGKHKKTFPKIYDGAFQKNISKMDFKKKRLSKEEITLLQIWYFDNLFSWFMEKLKVEDPLIARLLIKIEIVGVRFVNSKNGNRYELCFANNLKIKCGFSLYNAHPNKLPTVHLNY